MNIRHIINVRHIGHISHTRHIRHFINIGHFGNIRLDISHIRYILIIYVIHMSDTSDMPNISDLPPD